MRVLVQDKAFDPAHEMQGFGAGDSSVGAVVSFTGIVRDESHRLTALEIEHYPGMTEAAITEFAEEAIRRFSLSDALVIHRYGRLSVGETIMMVATAAPHRKAAFEAAEYLMDYLKSRAPFWKKEITPEGESWVAAKASDEDSLSRW